MLNFSGVIPIDFYSLLWYATAAFRTHSTMTQDNIQPLLAELHLEVVTELLTRVRSGDATTADINAAIKLLKDNNITVEAIEDSPVTEIVATLPFLIPRQA